MSRTTKIPYQEIVKRNQEEGISVPELAKIYNISQLNIYSYLSRNSIKTIPMEQDRRVNKPFDNILDNIDSEEKAYFLGIMLADGCIHTSITRGYKYELFGLFLKSEDFILINKICTFLGITSTYSHKDTMVGFTVSSKQIISKLKELGIIQHKVENNLHIPKINSELISHFIRGYFDGDGSVSIRSARPNQIQVYICGTHKEFLEELSDVITKNKINTKFYKEDRSKLGNKTMWTLRVTTHKDRCLFFEYLYKNATIYLDRKYLKFKTYYDNTVLNTEINNSVSV